jgi:hypothetical protein
MNTEIVQLCDQSLCMNDAAYRCHDRTRNGSVLKPYKDEGRFVCEECKRDLERLNPDIIFEPIE